MDPSSGASIVAGSDLNFKDPRKKKEASKNCLQQPGHLAPHFSENHCVAQKNCLPARGFPPRFQAIFLSGRPSKLPGAAFSPWVPFFFLPKIMFFEQEAAEVAAGHRWGVRLAPGPALPASEPARDQPRNQRQLPHGEPARGPRPGLRQSRRRLGQPLQHSRHEAVGSGRSLACLKPRPVRN